MPRSLAFSSSNSALDNRPASFSLPSSHSASVSSMLNSSLDVFFFARVPSVAKKLVAKRQDQKVTFIPSQVLLKAPSRRTRNGPPSLSKEQPRLEGSRLTAAWYAFRLRTDLRLRLRDSTRISRATGSALLLRVTEDLSRNRCDPHLPLQVNDQQQQGQAAVAQAERIARRRREGRLQFSSMLTCGRRSSPCPVDQDLRKSSGSEQRQCTDTCRSHIHTLQHSPTK